MEQQLLAHIMEIKERLASIEAHSAEMKEDLRLHREEAADSAQRVAALKAEVDETRGSIRAIKWVLPVVISVVALIVKFIH